MCTMQFHTIQVQNPLYRRNRNSFISMRFAGSDFLKTRSPTIPIHPLLLTCMNDSPLSLLSSNWRSPRGSINSAYIGICRPLISRDC